MMIFLTEITPPVGMMTSKSGWEYLEKEEWKVWRNANNLSLRQAGRILKVTGELVRQWEIGYCVPNLETQELMVNYLKGLFQLPKQEKIIATNQQLKKYLEERALTNIKPSMLSKLAGITVVKAKQWLSGDLIISQKDKLNNPDSLSRIEKFLNGNYDNLIILKKNSWTLITPLQLKEFRTKNRLSVDEMVALIGTSRPNYYNWEQNKYAPDTATQQKLQTLLESKNDNDQADSKIKFENSQINQNTTTII